MLFILSNLKRIVLLDNVLDILQLFITIKYSSFKMQLNFIILLIFVMDKWTKYTYIFLDNLS